MTNQPGRGRPGHLPPAADEPAAAPRANKAWLALAIAGAAVGALLAIARPTPQPVPGAAPQAARAVVFDSTRAFADLTRQVELGPRVPNTKGHQECRKHLVDTLKALAPAVESQDFTQRVRGQSLAMSNVIARWPGSGGGSAKERGVLLAAHWDTRPSADYEATDERRRQPIPGANDGASGVAVLLEMARMFKQTPPSVPVLMVLFDGEDYGPGIGQMFLGSKHFADHLPTECPRKGILLDMIGDRELTIPQEAYSARVARDIVDEVYAIAARRGYEKQFPAQPGTSIEDDHVPLHAKGLRVIDLIDFSYGPGHSWWHTLEDTPDKCSPASLKAVGDVVLEWVYRQK